MKGPVKPSSAPAGNATASASTQDALNLALARKARIDSRIAARSLSKSARARELFGAAAGAASLFLATATLVGGGFTIFRWLDDRANEREIRTEERLTGLLGKLSSSQPSERIGAVSALGLYVDEQNKGRNQQIMLALANAISVERDVFVQRAMIEFFDRLNFDALDPSVSSLTLQALVNYNRALAANLEPHPADVESLDAEDSLTLRRLNSLSALIVKLIRRGGKLTDYSGTYLADLDLRGAHLENADFSNATLAYSNLSGAYLYGAKFVNTNVEGVKFNRADLRASLFEYKLPGEDQPVAFMGHSRYFYLTHPRGERNSLTNFAADIVHGAYAAEFICADLRNTKIHKLPIGYVGDGRSSLSDFAYAKMEGAEFYPIFLSYGEKVLLDSSFSVSVSSRLIEAGENSVWATVPADHANLDREKDEYLFDYFGEDGMFGGSIWTGARMPPWAAQFATTARRSSRISKKVACNEGSTKGG